MYLCVKTSMFLIVDTKTTMAEMFIFDFCIHFDYIFVFHDYDDEHPAGATGRKGVLTPPHHMIPPLSFIIPLSCLLCFELVFRYMNF